MPFPPEKKVLTLLATRFLYPQPPSHGYAQIFALVTRLCGTTIAEFTEVESTRNRRAKLQAALELCRLKKATLLLARLESSKGAGCNDLFAQ